MNTFLQLGPRRLGLLSACALTALASGLVGCGNIVSDVTTTEPPKELTHVCSPAASPRALAPIMEDVERCEVSRCGDVACASPFVSNGPNPVRLSRDLEAPSVVNPNATFGFSASGRTLWTQGREGKGFSLTSMGSGQTAKRDDVGTSYVVSLEKEDRAIMFGPSGLEIAGENLVTRSKHALPSSLQTEGTGIAVGPLVWLREKSTSHVLDVAAETFEAFEYPDGFAGESKGVEKTGAQLLGRNGQHALLYQESLRSAGDTFEPTGDGQVFVADLRARKWLGNVVFTHAILVPNAAEKDPLPGFFNGGEVVLPSASGPVKVKVSNRPIVAPGGRAFAAYSSGEQQLFDSASGLPIASLGKGSSVTMYSSTGKSVALSERLGSIQWQSKPNVSHGEINALRVRKASGEIVALIETTRGSILWIDDDGNAIVDVQYFENGVPRQADQEETDKAPNQVFLLSSGKKFPMGQAVPAGQSRTTTLGEIVTVKGGVMFLETADKIASLVRMNVSTGEREVIRTFAAGEGVSEFRVDETGTRNFVSVTESGPAKRTSLWAGRL